MTTNQQQDDWQDCAAGDLSQMVNRINTAQRRTHRRHLYGKTAAWGLLIACGVFTVGSILDPGDSRYGGISCDECIENFVAYHGHKNNVSTMEMILAASMATHLNECKSCRDSFEQTYPGILSAERANLSAVPVFVVASSMPLY